MKTWLWLYLFADKDIELTREAVYCNRGVADYLTVDFDQGTGAIKRLYSKS